MPRSFALILAFVLLVAAACGGDGDDAPSGVTTAVPTPEATSNAEATSTARPASTVTPEPADTPRAAPASDTPPSALGRQLAALGGEDPAIVTELFERLTPRCQQSPEELGKLLERAWTALRETYDVALPITSMVSRIVVEIPAGSSRENCETLITAVIIQIVGR